MFPYINLGTGNVTYSADNPKMRINLTTPFAEKDAVKALGARWDAVKKLWYVVDVADLTPFARWIPSEPTQAMQPDATDPKDPLKSRPMQTSHTKHPPATRVASPVPMCGCKVLPWEDCEHTTKPPQGQANPTS
jgi:hypothetical protein